MMEEYVILVDEQDRDIGQMEKLEAHRLGRLHRAFSVFICNDRDEIMLHRRADRKYHSGGLWTNACCSHPRSGENVLLAAHRRLQEEMGFDTELEELFTFIYKAELDGGMTEHEFDHVLVGSYTGQVSPDPEEVSDWKWMRVETIQEDMATHPEHYTQWFRIIFDRFAQYIKSK